MVESRRVDVRRNRWAACLSACVVLASLPESAVGQIPCQVPGTVINYGGGDYEVYQDHDGDGCVDCIDYWSEYEQSWYYCSGQGDDPDPSDPAYSCVTCADLNCVQYGPPGGWLSTGCPGCSCGHEPDGTCSACPDPCDGMTCPYGCTNGVCDPDPCAGCAYGCTNGVCDDPPDCPYGGTYPDCNDPPPECSCGGTYPDCTPCECTGCDCGCDEVTGDCLTCNPCECGEDEYGQCLTCPDPPPCDCDVCDSTCDENNPDWPRCTPCCDAAECESSNPWECQDCECLEQIKGQFDVIWEELKTGFLPTTPNYSGQPIEFTITYPLPSRVGTTTSEFRFNSVGEILTTHGMQGLGDVNSEVANGIAMVRAAFLYMVVFAWAYLAVGYLRQS